MGVSNTKLSQLLDVGEKVPYEGNRQAFVNHPRPEVSIDPLSQFHNPKDPNLIIQHEKPEHRMLLLMKVRGLSNNEIARHSGYTVSWISQLFRQPWARALLCQLMREAGVDEVQTILQGACADSLHKLIDLRDDPETPAAVSKGCSEYLVNRFLGTPPQTVTVTQKVAGSAEVGQIDQEIQRLEAEEKRLLGKN